MKYLLGGVIIACIAAFFILGGQEYASLDMLKEQRESLQAYYENHPAIAIAAFMGLYILVTALSLPLATVITLLGGALFGVWLGLLLASFASTIGASLAFLTSRFMFRDVIEARYSKQLAAVNEGVRKEGGFYLFALRLTPLFPFFMVNILMGVLSMPLRYFYIISQIGMLPGTAVYVYAGTQLSNINEISDILSPALLAAFVALGVFPLVAKKLVSMVRNKVHDYGKV